MHKGGAKFDFEKAKWFNQEWIKRSETARLLPLVQEILKNNDIDANEEALVEIIPMVKERCQLINDFVAQVAYFFNDPLEIDLASVQPKWDDRKQVFFEGWTTTLNQIETWDAVAIENTFKEAAALAQIKPGELQLPLRIMLVGAKFGPTVFDIAFRIGKEATTRRIGHCLTLLAQ
jgi:glutamyl-tRNA synthetase